MTTRAWSWSRVLAAGLGAAVTLALAGCPVTPVPIPPAPPGLPDPEKRPPGEPIHDVTPKSEERT